MAWRSLTITIPFSHEVLQLASCLLEIQHSREKEFPSLRRFLNCEEYTFLTQLKREPREADPQDLLFVNRDRLVQGVVAEESLGQSDHITTVFNSQSKERGQ